MKFLALIIVFGTLFASAQSPPAAPPGCQVSTNTNQQCPPGSQDCPLAPIWSSNQSNVITALKYKLCYPVQGGGCCSDECGVQADIFACTSYPSTGPGRCAWVQQSSTGACLSFNKLCLIYTSGGAVACTANKTMCQWLNGQCVAAANPSINPECPSSSATIVTQDAEAVCGSAIPGWATALMVLTAIAFVAGVAMIVVVTINQKKKRAAAKSVN